MAFLLSTGASSEFHQRERIPLTGKVLPFDDKPGPYTYQSVIIHYKSKDFASIEATLLTPDSTDPKPGLIFVHMWARDRNTFWGLPEYLATYGYPSIYLDLRGHGNSNFPYDKPDKKITISDTDKNYSGFYMDILPAIEIMMVHKNVKEKQLILIAASLGCPLGVKAVAQYKDHFIGMIHMSPAVVYFDVDCKKDLKELTHLPTFVILEKTDKSFGGGQKFFSIPDQYKTLLVVDKIGHGTDMLFHNIGFPTLIRTWMEHIEYLSPWLTKLREKQFLIESR
ncbi:MAG: alpha/beta fold hydrolase [Candidatus Aureabacteria bacterium]|nr:alpha/beta fold hydrolase [Candidatus Auribacterota bacterium]